MEIAHVEIPIPIYLLLRKYIRPIASVFIRTFYLASFFVQSLSQGSESHLRPLAKHHTKQPSTPLMSRRYSARILGSMLPSILLVRLVAFWQCTVSLI